MVDEQIPDTARILGLAPHPEGGWYGETWRSDVVFEVPVVGMSVQAVLPSISCSRLVTSRVGMWCVLMNCGSGMPEGHLKWWSTSRGQLLTMKLGRSCWGQM